MASCKDCLSVDVCCKHKDTCCEHFKDSNRFVELPCKVGDIIYEIKERKRNGEWKKVILDRVVYGIEVGIGGCMTVRSGTTITIFLSELNKTVFLTREEAERALKNNENRIME